MSASVRPDDFRGAFRIDAEARAVYSEAAGIARIEPHAVAVPEDADDVVALVRWAAGARAPLVPRGSGSSMAGGAIGDGVIVDLGRIAWMDPVDRDRHHVRCGPGVVRDDLDAAARAAGLRFPVDPSSGAFCTVGGMASTNAAGARTLRYGAMRAWVNAVECVFADGSRAWVRRGEPAPDVAPFRRFLAEAAALADAERRVPSRHAEVRKESSGYGVAAWAASGDLVDLLVGSEGTLALFVALELRLAPLLPATASVLGAFASLEAAVEGAARARAAGASACELLDRTFLDVARSGGASVPVPPDAEAVLLAEAEGHDVAECATHARMLEMGFRAAGATRVVLALDPETEHGMWELRHAASPILSRLDPMLKSMQFIEDGCVPPDRLADYVRGVRAALDRHGIRGVIFGHAGDAHVHVNPLVNVAEPAWRSRVEALLDDVAALTASLGGTLSGEHGDGRLRAPLLPRVWSAEALAHFATVKHAFDPDGILNPGAKVATPGERAVQQVKYDPSLPPLPGAASDVLALVERARAYARPRLELLAAAHGAAASHVAPLDASGGVS
jgi:FAD/FMN-containing dehydrogenase